MAGAVTDDFAPAAVSAPVRAAMAFVQEHARDALRIVDIADAAGMTARGLQAAFNRQIEMSPMDYLRRIRLEGLHRELSAVRPTEDVTVMHVARRWRFSNAGRLATAYRAMYGVAPSITLHADPVGHDRQEQPERLLAGNELSRRRFRLVLDCDVDVTDPAALTETVQAELDRHGRAWNNYLPDGGTEDLIAFLFTRAIRHATVDANGIALLSINPSVRVPDTGGAYAAEILPGWSGSAGTADGDDA